MKNEDLETFIKNVSKRLSRLEKIIYSKKFGKDWPRLEKFRKFIIKGE
jgi:hypothetical protein